MEEMRQEGEALEVEREKGIREAWPQGSLGGRREGKKKRRKRAVSAKLGQSLGGSWPSRERRVNACLGSFAQHEVFLETAGFVSRDLVTHVGSGMGSWLAEVVRALFGASRFQSEYQKAGNGCISDSFSVICTKDEAREVLGDRDFTMFGVFVSRTVISPANRQELAQGSSYHWVSGVALAPVEWGGGASNFYI